MVGKRMVQRGGRGDRGEREGRRRGEHGGSPESETKPWRGRARLRPTMPVVVVVDDDGDRVTAAAALYLSLSAINTGDASGERRDAERRRIAPPRTKDVEFEKCYSARLSLNDMEGNASPTWVSHVCASAVRARAPRGSFARVYLPKTCSRVSFSASSPEYSLNDARSVIVTCLRSPCTFDYFIYVLISNLDFRHYSLLCLYSGAIFISYKLSKYRFGKCILTYIING